MTRASRASPGEMNRERPGADLDYWLRRWDLALESEPWSTPSSRLALVRRLDTGTPAVVKVPLVLEERRGCRLMSWWAGDGAARVYTAADDADAVLLERAVPGGSLRSMSESATPPRWEADAQATTIMVAVVRRLHDRPQVDTPGGLVPLTQWFRELFSWADRVGGYYRRAAMVAADLLADQRDCRVLHGDIHHENVLWFGPDRGWLAIDPKGLIGDPAFDYANLLTNPGSEVTLRPGRFDQQIDLVSTAAGIDRERLLRWVVAWAGLSAAWYRTPQLSGRAAETVQVGLLAERRLRAKT